jgi:hypothetical protein
MVMSRRQSIWILLLLALALQAAWAQDSSGAQQPADNPQEPAPAVGDQNPAPPITENPPLSGMDQPGLEPHAAPLSYLQPGATVSESMDSNVTNLVGAGGTHSVTRGLGSVTLQRLWSNYDLALDYIGGASYYNLQGQGFKALQQMDLDQKITWKRGQLSVRDSFSYLPEGNFGAAYGSLGSQGIASLGNTAFGQFWGGSSLGTVGLASRIMNVSMADISEYLTPKSAVTAAGGYAFTHFYGNDVETGSSFIGSSQVSVQVGYNRVLSPHTQVALVYGYQGFDFPTFGNAFHSHIVQLMYGHRISGRMDFLLAAGPQYTRLQEACSLADVLLGNVHCGISSTGLPVGSIPDTRIGVAGRAQLRYRFPKTSLDLSYERYETSGSGLFAGAQTDTARLGAERPLTRVWTGFADLGYARNSRMETPTPQAEQLCGENGQPACPGIDALTYNAGYAGIGARRRFGHDFNVFFSYQFNQLSFDHSFCGTAPVCSRLSNRHVGTIGLDWTPRPIRLD